MKMEKPLAGAALFVLPFVFSSGAGEQFRAPKVLFLLLLVSLYICYRVFTINQALGCSGAFALISACCSPVALDLPNLLPLVAAFITCLWVAYPTEDHVKIGLKILKYIGCVCATYAIGQHYGYDLIGLFLGHDLVSFINPTAHLHPPAFFGQQTLYGPFAAACFACALFDGSWWLLPFLGLPIVFIDSSFTYLSLGVVLTVYSFYQFGPRCLFLALLAPPAFFLLCQFPEFKRDLLMDNGRFPLWVQVWELSKNHPSHGYGFGSFKTIYPAFQSADIRAAAGIDESKLSPKAKAFTWEANRIRETSGLFLSAHNEFLQVFFECGVIGLLLVAWIFVSYFWAAIFLPYNASIWCLHAIFWSFMANSLGNFPLHLIPQALLPLWAFVAVTTIDGRAILD